METDTNFNFGVSYLAHFAVEPPLPREAQARSCSWEMGYLPVGMAAKYIDIRRDVVCIDCIYVCMCHVHIHVCIYIY